MEKIKITACILTKNEEKNISRSIKSAKWCDEIIIVDDYSTDKTLSLARKFKVKIYKRKLNDNFAQQRNFALSKARGKWVLFLDADEEVSPKLADEIKRVITTTKLSGFYIARKDCWLGKNLTGGESGNNKILRLGRRKVGKWKRRVHETWNIKGKVGILKNKIIHYPHQNINEFIDHINYYSQIHTFENESEQKQANIYKIILYPPLKFINNFIFKKGYRDDTHGFVAAVIMSFHSFLAWSRLWLVPRK
jgi:glycosyltransferase involved in cell wall biosynthesis